MSITQQTLLVIYHPEFRKGYQQGRQKFFQEQIILTDKQFVEDLQTLFQELEQKYTKQEEEALYYTVGGFIGQMSAVVIPLQPHEDNTRELQAAFLAKVAREHGAAGQALIEAIRQFWTIQDQLAQTLDADIFEQMLNRGVENVSFG